MAESLRQEPELEGGGVEPSRGRPGAGSHAGARRDAGQVGDSRRAGERVWVRESGCSLRTQENGARRNCRSEYTTF